MGAGGTSFPIRVFITNESGYYLDISLYREVTDQRTRQVNDCPVFLTNDGRLKQTYVFQVMLSPCAEPPAYTTRGVLSLFQTSSFLWERFLQCFLCVRMGMDFSAGLVYTSAVMREN